MRLLPVTTAPGTREAGTDGTLRPVLATVSQETKTTFLWLLASTSSWLSDTAYFKWHLEAERGLLGILDVQERKRLLSQQFCLRGLCCFLVLISMKAQSQDQCCEDSTVAPASGSLGMWGKRTRWQAVRLDFRDIMLCRGI